MEPQESLSYIFFVLSGYESDLEREKAHWHHQTQEDALAELEACNLGESEQEAETDVFVRDNAWMDEYRKGVVSRYEPSNGTANGGWWQWHIIFCNACCATPQPVIHR